MNKLFVLIFFGIILSIGLASAVTITDIFGYSNPFTTSSSSIQLGWNITSDSMQNLTFNWDNTNYSLYDSSLVLFYNFDNRSALGENYTRVIDLSKYGNNGTFVGGSNISWTPNGKYGGAFNFSGGVNYINVGTMSNINFSNNFAISLWIYNINSSSHFVDYDKDATNKFFDFSLASDDKLYYLEYNSTGNAKAYYSSSLIHKTASWINIVLVIDRSNNLLYFYKGGTIFYNVSLDTIGGSGKGSPTLFIGSSRGTAGFLNGTIDDVMIFNKSLSANQISQLYKSSLTKYDSQNWSFQTNQTTNNTLNSSQTSYNWNYNLCSSNSTTQVCSANKTITQTIPIKTLTANFTSSIGNVPNNYYGITMVTTDSAWLRNGYANLSDLSISSDTNWHRDNFLNGGFNLAKETITLDNFYDNSSDGSINRTGDTTNITLEYQWARQNGVKIHNLIVNTPTWLADNSSGYCSNLKYCPPTNYTYFGELVKDYINRTTNNGEYLDVVDYEFWNEPEYFLMDLLPTDHINKSIEINKMFNATATIVRQSYPNTIIGGIALLHIDTSLNMSNNFISNFSINMTALNHADFISFHKFLSPYYNNINDYMQQQYLDIKTTCDSLGANCSNLIMSEYNIDHITDDILIRNTTSRENEYSNAIAQYYSSSLNSYQTPQILYFWTANYPESEFWAIVKEPINGLMYKAPYNVTKSFAHLCQAGSTVYQSSSDDNTIKVVTCKDSNKYNIIIINTDTVSKNISLSGLPFSDVNLVDSLGNNYNVSSNSTNLGIQDLYGINYLTYDSTPATPTTGGGGYSPVCNSLYLLSSASLCIGGTQNKIYIDGNGCANPKVIISNCNLKDDLMSNLDKYLNLACIDLNKLNIILNGWKNNIVVTMSQLNISLNKFKYSLGC